MKDLLMAADDSLERVNPIEVRIFTVRGERIMLDSDLAVVYGVQTKNLNKAVERNNDRFPEEFAFRLTEDEWDRLRFQIGTSKSARGGRRYLPRVFTEHGAVMLASVLNSDFAVKASIQVVRAFVRLRRVMEVNRSLAEKVEQIAEKVDHHERAIAVVFHELGRMAGAETPDPEPEPPKRRIGYRTSKDQDGKTTGRRRK